jgi:hypothetical protein
MKDKNVNSYLECALWSSTDQDDYPLDYHFGIKDLATETVERAQRDLDAFLKLAGDLIDSLDLEQVAHDFWLTRNRHGAGFWDGDYDKTTGEKLTELSHSFGEINLYVGDDFKLYFDRN